MKGYIEKSKLLDNITQMRMLGNAELRLDYLYNRGIDAVIRIIRAEAPADVISPVRCRDCEYGDRLVSKGTKGAAYCPRSRMRVLSPMNYCSFAAERKNKELTEVSE